MSGENKDIPEVTLKGGEVRQRECVKRRLDEAVAVDRRAAWEKSEFMP